MKTHQWTITVLPPIRLRTKYMLQIRHRNYRRLDRNYDFLDDIRAVNETLATHNLPRLSWWQTFKAWLGHNQTWTVK